MPPRSSSSLTRFPSLRKPYICAQCRHTLPREQRRSISEAWKARLKDAEAKWAARGEEIKSGQRQSMVKFLESRGLLNDVVGKRETLDWLFTEKRIGVYCGIDPTAPSLHVGHLAALMALFWMYLHGFHAIAVIGGGTARIGDPTGRTTDRPQMSSTERKANVVSMHYQAKKLFDNVEKVGAKHGYKQDAHWRKAIDNNSIWWNKTPFTDVLKLMGSGMRIGAMLGRDTVKTKMDSGAGMSFAEFAYPVMQAWDWWHLYNQRGIQVQIGGADQYGNILAGVDGVKHVLKTLPDKQVAPEKVDDGNSPIGFTVPLLTTAAGEKFGKSAGNAIWLDQTMTSLFDLYAFLVKTADEDVERYLRMFTFLPLDTISGLMSQHSKDKSQRIPQHELAYHLIEFVHGKENADKARRQYQERSEQRKMTALSSLVNAPEATQMSAETTLDASPKPSEVDSAGAFAETPVNPDNPWLHNQNPATRAKATWMSPRSNPFAPPNDPNKPGQGAVRVTLPASLIKDQAAPRVLHSAGLVASRSEGHNLCVNGGAYVGKRPSNLEQMSDDLQFVPVKPADVRSTWTNVIRDQENGQMDKEGEEGLLVMRVGKWRVRVIRLVTDEVFEKLNLPDPPGWSELKALKAAARARGLEDTESDTADRSFVDPEQKISRREAEEARRHGRKQALDYLETQTVRRQLSHYAEKNLQRPLYGGFDLHANEVSNKAETKRPPRDEQIGGKSSSLKFQSIFNSPRDDPSMTPDRLARVMQLKQRQQREAHREGTARAQEVLNTARRSQRAAEGARLDRMRAQAEEQQAREKKQVTSGEMPQRISRLPATTDERPIRATSTCAGPPSNKIANEAEMKAAMKRRKREREKVVSGMADSGLWRGDAAAESMRERINGS